MALGISPRHSMAEFHVMCVGLRRFFELEICSFQTLCAELRFECDRLVLISKISLS